MVSVTFCSPISMRCSGMTNAELAGKAEFLRDASADDRVAFAWALPRPQCAPEGSTIWEMLADGLTPAARLGRIRGMASEKGKPYETEDSSSDYPCGDKLLLRNPFGVRAVTITGFN